jgi:GDP-L-fucose synthase
MKTILITGGSGLVGKAIKSIISKTDEYIFLSSKDGDLRDFNYTVGIFRKYRPTHVIHLAARVGGLYDNMNNNIDFFRANMMINDNVLRCCVLYDVEKVVSCLSTCIFPDNIQYPIDETMVHNGPPHESNEGYSYAKRMLEIQSRMYSKSSKTKMISVIPTNIYGPHDNFHLGKSHVVPGLIHKCFISKKSNTPLVCYGSGTPLRQFIYSKDVARLMLWCLENYDDIEPIILSPSPDKEISIRDLVGIITKHMEFDNDVIWNKDYSDGQYRKTASNKKLTSIYPEFVMTDLDDGIRETVEWFVETYPNCRV